MANLKMLLGDRYQEGMSLAEVDLALAHLDLVDRKSLGKTVSKEQFDKAASAAARYKKQLAAGLSEREALQARILEEKAEKETRCEFLLHRAILAELTVRYLVLGYDEKLAGETAAAMMEGDLDRVFDNQAYHLALREQSWKESWHKCAGPAINKTAESGLPVILSWILLNLLLARVELRGSGEGTECKI